MNFSNCFLSVLVKLRIYWVLIVVQTSCACPFMQLLSHLIVHISLIDDNTVMLLVLFAIVAWTDKNFFSHCIKRIDVLINRTGHLKPFFLI